MVQAMFPTTMWSTIREAGQRDNVALGRFAERYRPAVLAFARRRGFAEGDAEDICQDVFVRLLRGNVLAGAHPEKGRFRSLLLAVTQHVIIDRLRRQRSVPIEAIATQSSERDEVFDREWVLHLAATALDRLGEQGSPYYPVLKDHLAGIHQDRKRLWIARRKLIALIRHEIAMTCASHREFEEEVAYLSAYLRPGRAAAEPAESADRADGAAE